MSEEGFVGKELSEYPPGTLLDGKALAKALGVSPRSLRRMAARFEIPTGMKVGRSKRWLAGQVLAFLETRAIQRMPSAETKHVSGERVF
jgi:predicted DNA-binding transcriptional regulator AlpA